VRHCVIQEEKEILVLIYAPDGAYQIESKKGILMGTLTGMVNVDGVVSPMADAKVPVLDRGFLYGDSVYEVFRTEEGVPLFLSDHFDRLENSARLIQMRISQSRDELIQEIRRTVIATDAQKSDRLAVRFQITRGEGPLDLAPPTNLVTRYVLIVKEAPVWRSELYAKGLRMAITAVRRNPVNSLDPNIKGGNYLNNILALSEARAAGADDAVMLTREGYVAEASNSNVWFLINDELRTPSRGNLRGLTKMHVHKALGAEGIMTQETDIHVDELPQATECFVTSATRDVMPCASLVLEDGAHIKFPEGGGPLTRKTRESFESYIQAYVKRHRHQSLI
jgi:branched-chain amino acid aminotransferase